MACIYPSNYGTLPRFRVFLLYSISRIYTVARIQASTKKKTVIAVSP